MAYSIPRARSLHQFQAWSAAWSGRHRPVPTVLAPGLPALILLGVLTAGMVDPPPAGLITQLHLTSATTATAPSNSGSAAWSVTPR